MLSTSACCVCFLFNTVFLVELINTATCLSRFLLSCIERMALGADLEQISTWMFSLVEPVTNVFPQLHVTVA